MDNYDRVQRAVKISTESAGESARQYERHMKSVQTAIKKLSATYEDFLSRLTNSNIVRGIIESLTKLLNLINGFGPANAIIIGFLSLYALHTRIATQNTVRMIEQEALLHAARQRNLATIAELDIATQNQVRNEVRLSAVRNGLISRTQAYIAFGQLRNTVDGESLTLEQRRLNLQTQVSGKMNNMIDGIKRWVASINARRVAIMGEMSAETSSLNVRRLSNAETTKSIIAKGLEMVKIGGLTVANVALTGVEMAQLAIKKLLTVATLELVGAMVLTIATTAIMTAGISLLMGAFSYLISRLDRAKVATEEYEKAKASRQAREEELNDLKAQAERYEELSEKINLTVEEKEELLDIGRELEQSGLARVIDEETAAIALNKQEVEKLIQQRERLREVSLRTETRKSLQAQLAEGAIVGGTGDENILATEEARKYLRMSVAEGKEKDIITKRLVDLSTEAGLDYLKDQADAPVGIRDMATGWAENKAKKVMKDLLKVGVDKDLKRLENDLKKLSSGSTDVDLEKTSALYDEIQKKMDSIAGNYGAKILGESFGDLLNDYTQEAISYDKSLKQVLEGVDAYSERGELLQRGMQELIDGSLDTETLQKLIENFSELREYIEETGDITLDKGKEIEKMYSKHIESSTLLTQKIKEENSERLKQARINLSKVNQQIGTSKSNIQSLGQKAKDVPALLEEKKVLADLEKRRKSFIKQIARLEASSKDLTTRMALEKANLKALDNGYNIARKSLEKYTSRYDESRKIIDSIDKEGGLTTKTAESLIKNFPELMQYANSTDELKAQLLEKEKQYYDEAQEAYREMIAEKLKADKEYSDDYLRMTDFVALQAKLSQLNLDKELLEDALKVYQKDLSNFKTIEEAKLSFAQSLNASFESTYASRALASNNMDYGSAIEGLQEEVKGATSIAQAAEFQKAIEELENRRKAVQELDDSVKANIGKLKLSHGSKSGRKGSTVEIDYYEEFMKMLNSEIDALKDKRREIDKTSEAYRDSLHKENNIQREKLRLINRELEKSKAQIKQVDKYKEILDEVESIMATGVSSDIALDKVAYKNKAMKEYQDYFKRFVELRKESRELQVVIAEIGGEWWKSMSKIHDENLSQINQEKELLKAQETRMDNNYDSLQKQLELEKQSREEQAKRLKILENMVELNDNLIAEGKTAMFSNDELKKTKEEIMSIKTALVDIANLRDLLSQSIEAMTKPFTSQRSGLNFDMSIYDTLEDFDSQSKGMEIQSKITDSVRNQTQMLMNELIETNSTMMTSKGEDYVYYLEKSKLLNESVKESMTEYYSAKDALEDAKMEFIDSISEEYDKSIKNLEGTLKLIDRVGNLPNIDMTSLNQQGLAATETKLKLLKDQFDSLSSIEASSATEALKLADSLEEVAEQINETEVDRLGYMAKASTGEISALSDELTRVNALLSSQIDITQKNIDAIKKGYRTTDELMLDFSTLEEGETALEKQKQETAQIVEDYQSRYDKINKLRQQDFDSEMKMYEAYESISETTSKLYEEQLINFTTMMHGTNQVAADQMELLAEIMVNGHQVITEGIASSWDALNQRLGQYYQDTLNMAKATQSVLMTDKQGNMSIGYLRDGKTYDAQGNRPSEGTVVRTPDGRFWEMGGGEVEGFNKRKKNSLKVEKPKLDFSKKIMEKISLGKTSQDEQIKTISLAATLSKDMVKRIEEYRKERMMIDKLVEKAQKDILSKDNKNGPATQRLLAQIKELQIKDVKFQLDIQKELLTNQANALKEYKERAEKSYYEAIKQGDGKAVLEALKIYDEANGKYVDTIGKLDSMTESYYKNQFELLDWNREQMDSDLKTLQDEKKILTTITKDKEATLEITKKETDLMTKQRKVLLNQKEELKAQRDLLAVGSQEWNIVNEEVEKYEDLITASNLKIAENLKATQSLAMEMKKLEIEKQLLGGKTLDEVKKEREEYVDGLEKEKRIEDILIDVNRNKLNLSSRQLEILNAQGKVKREDLERIKKEIDLQKMQIRLDDLRQQKTKRQLAKVNGEWQYTYVADQDAIESAEKDLVNAQISKQQWEDNVELENIEDTLNSIESIMQKALEGGEFGSIVDFTEALRGAGAGYNIAGNLDKAILSFTTYLDKLSNISEASPVKDNSTHITIQKVELKDVSKPQEFVDGLRNAAKLMGY